MSISSTYYFTNSIRRNIKLRIAIIINLLINKLLRRRLSVEYVGVTNGIIFCNTEVQILWIVSGCHKIHIKGIGTFSGNSHGLKFLATKKQTSIEIVFFGFSNEIKKEIKLECKPITILNKFNCRTEISDKIPILLISDIEIPFNLTVGKDSLLSDNIHFGIDRIDCKIDSFSLKLDSFNTELFSQRVLEKYE